MLDYLEQWDRLNRTPVFDVGAHQGGFLAWQHDLEKLPGISFSTGDALGDVWLEIDRLRPAKPPAPSDALLPWLVIRDDPTSSPTHRETLPNPEDQTKPLIFEEIENLRNSFDVYVQKTWQKWSETETPRRKSISIYDKLFNLLQTIETEGAETALELVWGIGIAVWNKDGKRIRHPLISRLVEIDPISTDMSLRIRPRDVPPILETDIYADLDNPGLPAFENAARIILDHPDADIRPFDEASFEQILAGAAGALDRQARYWPRESDYELGKLPVASDALTITNTWVIFARKKGTTFLIDDIRRLREKAEKEPLPNGAPRILVETPEGVVPEREPYQWRGLSSSGFNSESSNRELYFPKPFNAEQVQIIDRLEHADGVVVQGPPGTGKTHTIANVICHYLAEGKRVLVTSKGESALSVLRGQLPVPVQSLTVSLLTSEREGLKQLEQSVSQITSEIANLNKSDLRKEIERCRGQIDQLHEKIRKIDRELLSWAEKNIVLVPHELGGLKPVELAERILEGRKLYDWFPDALDEREDHKAPLNDDEASNLRNARMRVGENLIYLNADIPDPASLPNSSDIVRLHRALISLAEVNSKIQQRTIPDFRSSDSQLCEQAKTFLAELNVAEQSMSLLSDTWGKWLLVHNADRSLNDPVFEVIDKLADEFISLVEQRRQFLGMAIIWQPEWDNDEHLAQAIENSVSGKSPFGIIPLGKKQARERFEAIKLNGQTPRTVTDWQWIKACLSLRQQTSLFVHRWNSLASENLIPILSLEPFQALTAGESITKKIKEARSWVTVTEPMIRSRIRNLFSDAIASRMLGATIEIESLIEKIELRLRQNHLKASLVISRQLRSRFPSDQLPLVETGIEFFDKVLGDSNYSDLQVEMRWETVMDDLTKIISLRDDFTIIAQSCQKIADAGAPIWANHLETHLHHHEEEWIPSDWGNAWTWSRQSGYLEKIEGRKRIAAITEKRLGLNCDLEKGYSRLVEKLTWLKLKETLDQDRGLMSALQQYMTAIRGIGAGTGIRAVRFRRDARRAMHKANSAIRCWIMPHWRVSESLPSEMAIFDLVVIDEASQSDLWALPALLRAKKVLIVGDNKQVSPSAIGVREADIRNLYARFLRELPYGDVLSPDKSVYDLGSVMFASDLVRLREHFRCVEPIISFSNRLCYNNEIRCLRVSTATERITPPLVDVFVRDGARYSGTAKTNQAEAKAIVDEIKLLTSDPAFSKRSIGVVSLLGNDQPKVIFEMLISELGEEKIVNHQIRCGDAMTFQGREVDVVFISMVSDGSSVRALSGEMYEQRFNVAASRAKDRLYLFRSFKREDLRPNDLRAKLLDHFSSPLHRDIEAAGRNRCESDFERAMYDRLNEAGYRIIPQVAAGGYRIDLVVEGSAGRRLAIECDGDQYHTPDVWMNDLHRQRTLERAGWTFWRCWGSSFLRDPEGCMNDLFAKLSYLEIEPIGATDLDLSEVVEYREVSGFTDESESLETEDCAEGNDAPTDPSPASEVPKNEFIDLPLNFLDPVPQVQVGDSVRFCYLDDKQNEVFVTIVDFPSNPTLGMINRETVIGQTLIGMKQLEIRNIQLLTGAREIQLLEMYKPTRH